MSEAAQLVAIWIFILSIWAAGSTFLFILLAAMFGVLK